VRRLAYLFAAGVLWLFVAAIPAFADGGPHVQSNNSGAGGLAADCAGCHRAHAAKTSASLLISTGTALCVSCHGSATTGAATNVAAGVQYTLATRAGGVVLGALRGGGFDFARIGSSTPTRVNTTTFLAKVPVLNEGAPTTSKHMSLTASAPGMAWGNGPANSAVIDPGVSVTLECTTCHNPHGNNQYRILRPIPFGNLSSPPAGLVLAGADAIVTDAALPPANDARNYTVIQTMGGTGTLLQSQVAGVVPSGPTSLAGDYWRKKVPWNDDTTYDYDAPNGIGGSGSTIGTFSYQMNEWCSTCHTRYWSTSRSDYPDSTNPDLIYKNRHTTRSSRTCQICHVAHGSNALMIPDPNTGTTFSRDLKHPDGSTPAIAGDSRLLKVDNRGTCQLCHDPTDSAPAAPSPGYWVGPTPAPLVP
jgi:predicted CXXCH cytochrome family protein